MPAHVELVPARLVTPTRRRVSLATAVALALVAVLLAAATACSSPRAPKAATSSPATLTYTNKEHGFTITYDARFERQYVYGSPLLGFKVGFFDSDGAMTGTKADNFVVNVVGTKDSQRTPVQQKKTLATLVAQYKATAPKRAKWTQTTIGGMPAAWQEDMDSATAYPRLTYLIVGRRNVYVLVGEAEPGRWAEARPQFVAAFQSFRELPR